MLLDVDPGAATNRTVVTFVGEPDAVEEAAFRAIKTAAALIDMTPASGRAPAPGRDRRLPVRSRVKAPRWTTASRSRDDSGNGVGDEARHSGLSVRGRGDTPGAEVVGRHSQGRVRGPRREAQGCGVRPDFGPARFHAKSGATVIGAREFLIAYNVNLNTRDKKLANAIAQAIREAGTVKSQSPTAPTTTIPGRFKECRAVGWYIEEFGRAQVSINLTNYKVTPLHDVFDAVCDEAAKLGLRVTGSELVGLIPREALLAAGDHYLAKQGKTTRRSRKRSASTRRCSRSGLRTSARSIRATR